MRDREVSKKSSFGNDLLKLLRDLCVSTFSQAKKLPKSSLDPKPGMRGNGTGRLIWESDKFHAKAPDVLLISQTLPSLVGQLGEEIARDRRTKRRG